MDPSSLVHLAEFFRPLQYLAPGSSERTKEALACVPYLGEAPGVVDLGCGTGASALVLAESLQTPILAVDISPLLLEEVSKRAASKGLHHLVKTTVGDIASPPAESESLDLIWSEGAAYILGFRETLECWRPLIRRGGYCVASECSWISPAPSLASKAFWRKTHPFMGNVSRNTEIASASGFEVLRTIPLGQSAWEHFHAQISRRFEDEEIFISDHLRNSLTERMSLYEKYRGEYDYVFYIMRRI